MAPRKKFRPEPIKPKSLNKILSEMADSIRALRDYLEAYDSRTKITKPNKITEDISKT
jgi:hypothetical protein